MSILIPGPRGRRYAISPHFAERWANRTLLPGRDIAGAVLTARVFAVARNGAEAMYAPAERRILLARPDGDNPWWVLLTVLYPPDPRCREMCRRGSRGAAFWAMVDRNQARLRAAGAA